MSSLPEERAVYATLKPERLPEHVAIIMDGNGRWAGRRSLKRFLGHQQGAKSVQLVTETASRIGLPWLTLYAFSLENNLRRPRAEVSFLMRLLKSYLESNVQRMMDNNVRMPLHRPHPRAAARSAGQDAAGPRKPPRATPAPRSPWRSITAPAPRSSTPSAASPPRCAQQAL